MGQFKEHYAAHPMAANASRVCGVTLAGFLCTATGTLTVTDANGTVLVSAVPVTAGLFTKIPLLTETSAGCTVSLASNAAGTLFT